MFDKELAEFGHVFVHQVQGLLRVQILLLFALSGIDVVMAWSITAATSDGVFGHFIVASLVLQGLLPISTKSVISFLISGSWRELTLEPRLLVNVDRNWQYTASLISIMRAIHLVVLTGRLDLGRDGRV